MGKYTVVLTEEFDKHLAHWKKVGNKAVIKKIGQIMLELDQHPTTGKIPTDPSPHLNK